MGAGRSNHAMSGTHYSELGVSPDADPVTLRAAYRAAMLHHHPDTNRSPDATDTAARINEAWACLRDPDRRLAYDEELRGPEEVWPHAHAPRRRWSPPPVAAASPPNPLTAAVCVVAAVAAVIPTMALMALAHGWDGSFAHTVPPKDDALPRATPLSQPTSIKAGTPKPHPLSARPTVSRER